MLYLAFFHIFAPEKQQKLCIVIKNFFYSYPEKKLVLGSFVT